MQIEESCGAIVWKKEKDKILFLILHRADEENVWEAPKGHRISSETEKETAIRELREELHIQNPSLDTEFRAILEYENSKGILMRYVFFLAYAETIKLSDEHDSYKWINIQELPIYFKYDDIRSVYRQAAERLSI